MKWSKHKAVTKAQSAIDSYNEQIRSLTEEIDQTNSDVMVWKNQLDESYVNLARLWVGQGSDDEIQAINSVLTQAKLEDVVARCEEELGSNRERVALISEDESYRDRQRLLKNVFPEQQRDIEKRLGLLDVELAPFQTDEFRFALAENLHIQSKATGVRGLWEGITGKSRRKSRVLTKLRETFDGESFASVVDRYQDLKQRRVEIEGEQTSLIEDQKSLKLLVDEFDEKSKMISNYDDYRKEALIKALVPSIAKLELKLIVSNVGKGLKSALAQCVVFEKKIEYATNLIQYLNREIEDRRKRVTSISGTQAKWRRYPKGSISAKSKWLEDVPNMKREGTHKRTRWSRQSRVCLDEYDDYDMFGNHLWHSHYHDRPFLAFDVFNHSTSHHMPYEGFTREVIPELAEHRKIHEQDGPPKEWLKEHSQEVINNPEIEEGDTSLDDSEPNVEPKDEIVQDYDAEVEGSELDDAESEANTSEWADDAAEAIADDIDDFDAGSSIDAS